MEKLSSSLEDYLETIYNEVEKKGFAKVTEISNILNVKKASVTGALNNLVSRKLINYEPYSVITLTNEGRELAGNILKKHRIMTDFFAEILRLSLEEAEQNACKIEHIMSEELFKRITNFSVFIQKYSSENEEFKRQLTQIFL
jgi:DtxR family Mn-dependent transcriptional regulator